MRDILQYLRKTQLHPSILKTSFEILSLIWWANLEMQNKNRKLMLYFLNMNHGYSKLDNTLLKILILCKTKDLCALEYFYYIMKLLKKLNQLR